MHERVLARRLAVLFPSDERPEQHAAERDHEQREGQAERLDRRVLRLHAPPRARLEHAEHDNAQTASRQQPSRRRRAGASAQCAVRLR